MGLGYGLEGPVIVFRLGERFLSSVLSIHGAHQVPYTMDSGSYPGLNRQARDITTQPHLVNGKGVPALV